MFAYCNNNSIVQRDPTGEIAEWLVVIAIGVALLFSGCQSEEEAEWPDDCPYEYWGEGGGRTNKNCYGFVFDYWEWCLPGQYGCSLERDWDPLSTDVTYTRESMINYVEADAVARSRNVYNISSPESLPNDALLVACKLTSDGKDFHFAVRLPNGAWLDKPGKHESRYNKINGFASTWVTEDNTYDSETIYFAYFLE